MTMTNENCAKQWPAGAAIDLTKSWLLSEKHAPIALAPENEKQGFQLKQLYAALDCEIVEVINLGTSGLILIVDEEGKFNSENKVNLGATLLWWEHVPYARNQDVIVGKAIVCHTSLLK